MGKANHIRRLRLAIGPAVKVIGVINRPNNGIWVL
jgi:hypothetical protein